MAEFHSVLLVNFLHDLALFKSVKKGNDSFLTLLVINKFGKK